MGPLPGQEVAKEKGFAGQESEDLILVHCCRRFCVEFSSPYISLHLRRARGSDTLGRVLPPHR